MAATVEASLPSPATPAVPGAAVGGFDGVELLPLPTGVNGQPLWAVFTHGTLSYDASHNHFLAIYTYDDTGWQELSRFELECADCLHPDSVRLAPVEPTKIWLEVQGGIGAYSSCYDLLSFDGQALQAEVSTWSPIPPNLGQLTDLNGDGTLEVVLDASDPYILSRSHGVRWIRFRVLQWDGSRFVGVELRLLPASSEAKLRDLNNRAVELAQAGLWPEAQIIIDQALVLAPHNPTAVWNAALIHLHVEGNRKQVESSPYPLLTNIFLGDYTAALETVRPYTPEEIFNPLSSLVRDMDAATWEDALSYWITTSTSQALEARPELAATHFLHGWAAYLIDPSSPTVLTDVERAAVLDPNEPLFSESLAYLKSVRE